MPISSNSTLYCDDVIIDTKEMAVICHKSTLRLNYNEYLILKHLVENDNSIVSKEMLMSVGWSDSVVTESSLHKAVFNLRSTLNLSETVKIKTIPGKGYMLICNHCGYDDGYPQTKEGAGTNKQPKEQPSLSTEEQGGFNLSHSVTPSISGKAARLLVFSISILMIAVSITKVTDIMLINKPITDQKIQLIKLKNIRVLSYKNQEVPKALLKVLDNRKSLTLFYNHYDQTSHIVIFDSETLTATNYYVKDSSFNNFIEKLSLKR